MKKLTANFRPYTDEAKPDSRTLGFAVLTIANAVRINGITVFKNAEGDGINIKFPGFGDDASYVVPHSPEAAAAMRDVIAMAVNSDDHFGYNKGDYGVHFEVNGKAVNEPYADGRFSVDVGDVCTLYGITTTFVEYKKNDKDLSFVDVKYPGLESYKDKNGEMHYPEAFKGRKSTWTDKDGNKQLRDYDQLIRNLVRAERKEILKDRKPALDEQVNDAVNKKQGPAKSAPGKKKEAERG